MKKLLLDNGREITTPWLNVKEAAKYCGMSDPTFLKESKDVPCSGKGRNRKYNTDDLDEWMKSRE